MGKRRKKKRGNWKARLERRAVRVADAGQMVDEAANIATAFGIDVKANPVHHGRTQNTWHVMLTCEETLTRLLEWWPTNGKWWCKLTGERGTSKDPEEVVQLAASVRILV